MEPPLLRIVLTRLLLIAAPFVVWFVWRAWARRTGREMGATPYAWLFAAGRNLVIDQYRSRATRAAAHDALEAANQIEERVFESAERTVERDAELRLVEAAMGCLPEELRTVLVLQVLGEQTSAEIGEALGRPAGTVRYQISRARKRLAEEIERLEREG